MGANKAANRGSVGVCPGAHDANAKRAKDVTNKPRFESGTLPASFQTQWELNIWLPSHAFFSQCLPSLHAWTNAVCDVFKVFHSKGRSF